MDTWTIASIWLRNTLLNQMILVPMVAILVLFTAATPNFSEKTIEGIDTQGRFGYYPDPKKQFL